MPDYFRARHARQRSTFACSVPHMLEAFMAGDRGFKRGRETTAPELFP
ncbi:DUF2274 domain-containing protein [Burkholderia gladioli]|nr:DUF2274 domain-containing protein [Burkholderia gladioli]MDN7500207.1 DUF2274 domain-containing protein [Burkholderia gladioli]